MLTIYQPTAEGKQKPQMTYKITPIQINLVPTAKSFPPSPPTTRRQQGIVKLYSIGDNNSNHHEK